MIRTHSLPVGALRARAQVVLSRLREFTADELADFQTSDMRKRTGFCDRTVRRALRDLDAAGYIRWERYSERASTVQLQHAHPAE